MFDGTGDPDDHICHYEAVGLTEGWTEEDLKTGFHRTLKHMALQWYERRVGTIHTDTWDMVKAFLQYFQSPTYKSDWSRECVRRKHGPQELVREYVTDKLRLMERTNANLSEDERVSQLHDGLREEIQMALGGHDWTTVDLLLKKAIGIEQTEEGRNKRSNSGPSSKTHSGQNKGPGKDPESGDGG